MLRRADPSVDPKGTVIAHNVGGGGMTDARLPTKQYLVQLGDRTSMCGGHGDASHDNICGINMRDACAQCGAK